jgi:hypothetical protein
VSFLVTYGPAAQITCVVCWKATRIVPDLMGQVTSEVLAHYKRAHVCGNRSGPWDVDDREGGDGIGDGEAVDNLDRGDLEPR